MPSSYYLEDIEIKNKRVFVTTFMIGTLMFWGYVTYYIVHGH